MSELMPHTAKMVDEICFIRSMHTEAINHEPAICYMQTGNQIVGRPCLGSWTSYGLGSLNQDLPTFVVLVARSTKPEQPQAIGREALVERLSSRRARRRELQEPPATRSSTSTIPPACRRKSAGRRSTDFRP